MTDQPARINPLRKPPAPQGETAAQEVAVSHRELSHLNLVPVVCGEFGKEIPAMADLSNRIVVPIVKK